MIKTNFIKALKMYDDDDDDDDDGDDNGDDDGDGDDDDDEENFLKSCRMSYLQQTI